MAKKTKPTPLEAAISWAGSIEALAHELRVHRDTVAYWRDTGRVPRPAARTIALLMEDKKIEEKLHGW